MAGYILILKTDSHLLGINTHSFTFDEVWNIMDGCKQKFPFSQDEEYLESLSWYERSYHDCFLDLRKCRRETLQGIQALMREHADSTHSYWRDFREKSLTSMHAEEGETIPQAIDRWEAVIRRSMIQIADVIEQKFQMEAGVT